MRLGMGRGKLLWVLGILLLGLAILVLSLPLWFPWILRPLAARAGAHLSGYQRVGYSHFLVQDLTLTNDTLKIRAHQVEGLVPTVWMWKLATGRGAGPRGFIRMNNLDCWLLPSDKPARSITSQVQDVEAALAQVKHWLPEASISHALIHSGNLVFVINDMAWQEGNLKAQVKLPAEASGATVAIRLNSAHPLAIALEAPSLGLLSTSQVVTNQSGFEINNTVFWQSNRLDSKASFGPNGLLPEFAAIVATNFMVRGEVLKLPELSTVAGSLSGQWEHGQFHLDLTALAQPAAGQTNLPPVDLNLQVRGDTNSATVQKLNIHSPFLGITLSNELQLSFSEPFVRGPAALSLIADLSRQPWVPLTGTVSGQADVIARPGRYPLTHLHLTCSDVGSAYFTTKTCDLAADLDWPLVELAGAAVRLDDGSTVNLSGRLNLEKKSAQDGHFQFAGPLLRQWLPSGYEYRDLSVSGTFSGPLTNLVHSGQVQAAEVTTPMLQPVSLTASWNGEAAVLEHFQFSVTATNASLSASGAASANAERSELRLASLSFVTNGTPALTLKEPTTIVYTAPKPGAGWRVVTTPIRCSGAGGELAAEADIAWPSEGVLKFDLEGTPVRLFAGLCKASLPQIDVQHLEMAGAWTNGPMILHVTAAASGSAQALSDNSGLPAHPASPPSQATPAEQFLSTPLKCELMLSGDARGILLSNLVLNSPTSVVATAHGFLPLTINPADGTNLVHLSSTEPLLLNASVRPEAFVWHNLSQLTGVTVDDPRLELDLSGTWRGPQGKIIVAARRVQLPSSTLTNLDLRDLRFTVNFDRAKAQLQEGQVLVQGQRVSVDGELPLGDSFGAGFRLKKLSNWEKATARLRISDAKLAAFEPLFPQILAPQGELNLDLELLPEARLEGALILRHARTRPLGNTAPLRDINVTLRFKDRRLDLENASANLSGSPVRLSGQVDLRGTNWLHGTLPPFRATLQGTNVPLAREPEYIVRSDLDLTIAKTNDLPPLVYGTAHLRDSFYLTDLSALVPGGVASPSSRPPYFSIDSPTVADWRLAVSVEGVRWLKVRSSLFNGEVSANFRLQGTLREPIALGVVKIDSGVVRFPFANLQLQQGLVTLTSENPYRPELLVRAASKQYGYDIRLEVSGTIDSPVIQFTSNPPLSSDQILLMITSGQLPPGSFSLTPQQRAETVALFLGRDLLAKLGLGDQSQNRLTISSGEEISTQGRPTYSLEYKLTPRWSVTGEYDRFGDFNAGFKWRIYSK